MSSKTSTTDTSLPGAVLRAWYGDTLMGFRMLFPLSTSVSVMYCPGFLNPSIQRCALKSVPDALRWLMSASPCSSVTPTTNVRSLPFTDAALFASSSPTYVSESREASAAARQPTRPRPRPMEQ